MGEYISIMYVKHLYQDLNITKASLVYGRQRQERRARERQQHKVPKWSAKKNKHIFFLSVFTRKKKNESIKYVKFKLLCINWVLLTQ